VLVLKSNVCFKVWVRVRVRVRVSDSPTHVDSTLK
jgi:hypothetical protein